MSQWQLVLKIASGEEDNKLLSSSLPPFLTKLFIFMADGNWDSGFESRKKKGCLGSVYSDHVFKLKKVKTF